MINEIREYDEKDINEIANLWVSIFGDKRDLVLKILNLLPRIGTCFVYCLNDKIVSMSFIFTGLKYKNTELGYIYAVATDSQYRKNGYAEKVVKECLTYAHKKGISAIATSPANLNLYDWYEKIINTNSIHNCSFEKVSFASQSNYCSLEEINSDEYNNIRNILLKSSNYIEFSTNYIEIENLICTAYNGGLFKMPNGLAACYSDANILYIKELICDNKNKEYYVMSLLNNFKKDIAIITEKGNSSRYVCYQGVKLNEDLYWGPVLD